MFKIDSWWEEVVEHRELCPGLCDDLVGGMGVGGRLRREGIHVSLWLMHVVVQQKPAQHCKATILQLKTEREKIPCHSCRVSGSGCF